MRARLHMSKKSSTFGTPLPFAGLAYSGRVPSELTFLSMSERRSPLLLPFELPSQGSSPPAGHTQGGAINFSRAVPYVTCPFTPSVCKPPSAQPYP